MRAKSLNFTELGDVLHNYREGGEGPSAADRQQKPGRNRRVGLNRFAVPSRDFAWHTRGIAIAALGISCFTAGLAWWTQQRTFYSLGFDLFAPSPEAAAQYAKVTLFADVLLLGLTCGLMVLSAMFLTHRILGPVFRLQSHMQSILDGKTPSELTLRDTDQLKDVASTYNALLHSLDLIEPKPMGVANDGGAENADSN